MALDVKKINPLDRQPRKAVGLDLPFSGQAVFNSTYQTKDALKINLINYFLTNKGERMLNPTFGSSIRELLFENINQSVCGFKAATSILIVLDHLIKHTIKHMIWVSYNEVSAHLRDSQVTKTPKSLSSHLEASFLEGLV